MTLKLGMITIDTTDVAALADWWAKQIGAAITQDNDGRFVVLDGGGLPVMLAFQKVDEPTAGKNRTHLDLGAPDLDAEVDRLVAAGASLVGHRGDGRFRGVTLVDPQGSEFDVAEDS